MFASLEALGVSYDDVVQVLEDEGVRSSRRRGTRCSTRSRTSSASSHRRLELQEVPHGRAERRHPGPAPATGVIAAAPTRSTRCATRGTAGSRGSPGPCVMVMFGVTGDLARKKLMPAVYDLANRGLLPPGFSLVGFARRDWEDQDFAADHLRRRSSSTRARRSARRSGSSCRRASGSSRASSTDDAAFDQLADASGELDAERGTGGNYAFYLSDPAEVLPDRGRAAQAVRAVADRGAAGRTPGGGW